MNSLLIMGNLCCCCCCCLFVFFNCSHYQQYVANIAARTIHNINSFYLSHVYMGVILRRFRITVEPGSTTATLGTEENGHCSEVAVVERLKQE